MRMGSSPYNGPRPEALESFIRNSKMNPTFLPISIVLVELPTEQPFIITQLVEITGYYSNQIARNILGLCKMEAAQKLSAPQVNRHLQPYERVEHEYWDIASDIGRIYGVNSQVLFDKGWEDVKGWHRNNKGIVVPVPDTTDVARAS